DGSTLHCLEHVLWQIRRNHELHSTLVVLRGVVVPLVSLRNDLTRNGCDRLTVAEHADLDFDSVEEFLDEDLVVVSEGELDRGSELGLVMRLRDPDRGSEPRGLDKAREAEGVLNRVALPQCNVARDRNPAVA